MKYFRLAAIAASLILLGVSIMVPSPMSLPKLFIEVMLIFTAIFWYKTKF